MRRGAPGPRYDACSGGGCPFNSLAPPRRRYTTRPIAQVLTFLYKCLSRWPAEYGASINAAPTLMFLRAHLKCLHPERTRRIPTGVDVDKFTAGPEGGRALSKQALVERLGLAENVVLWLMVQRLAPEKDTGVALDALRRLGESTAAGKARGVNGNAAAPPRVHLVIAGDGPSMAALQAEVRKHALPVTFLGNVDHALLPDLYRAVDVFLTCSTSETYGLTVVEALASGTPVVMPHCEASCLPAPHPPFPLPPPRARSMRVPLP